MTSSLIDPKSPRGFTLLEMAIVLVVFGMLSSGLLKGLSAYREQSRINEARQQLVNAREALLGFTLANGRLPCPSDPSLSSNLPAAGMEALVCTPDCASGDSICPLEHGALPWQTLGIEATDPWGNRLTYFVDKAFSQPLSEAEKAAGQRTRISLETNGRANIQERAGTNTLSEIPVVIISHGNHAQGAYGSNGKQRTGATGDEAENADRDLTFINHLPDETFDDLLAWIPATVIKAKLVSVGKLP